MKDRAIRWFVMPCIVLTITILEPGSWWRGCVSHKTTKRLRKVFGRFFKGRYRPAQEQIFRHRARRLQMSKALHKRDLNWDDVTVRRLSIAELERMVAEDNEGEK